RCPLTPRTFEKVRSKLPAAVIFYLMGNFRLRKFTLTSPIGRILTRALRDHNSAQADHNSRLARS
ncbi:MAG: hypothetical protein IKK01_04415, partial [Clostridia bacterium]|nr:hypothetical protein [Clostridia bacterium]